MILNLKLVVKNILFSKQVAESDDTSPERSVSDTSGAPAATSPVPGCLPGFGGVGLVLMCVWMGEVGSLSWNSSPGLECSGECAMWGLDCQEGMRVRMC